MACFAWDVCADVLSSPCDFSQFGLVRGFSGFVLARLVVVVFGLAGVSLGLKSEVGCFFLVFPVALPVLVGLGEYFACGFSLVAG